MVSASADGRCPHSRRPVRLSHRTVTLSPPRPINTPSIWPSTVPSSPVPTCLPPSPFFHSPFSFRVQPPRHGALVGQLPECDCCACQSRRRTRGFHRPSPARVAMALRVAQAACRTVLLVFLFPFRSCPLLACALLLTRSLPCAARATLDMILTLPCHAMSRLPAAPFFCTPFLPPFVTIIPPSCPHSSPCF